MALENFEKYDEAIRKYILSIEIILECVKLNENVKSLPLYKEKITKYNFRVKQLKHKRNIDVKYEIPIKETSIIQTHTSIWYRFRDKLLKWKKKRRLKKQKKYRLHENKIKHYYPGSIESKLFKFASLTAKEAVELDCAKKYNKAIVKYVKAAEILVEFMKYNNDPGLKQVIKEKINAYFLRAKQLKDRN